ncbi:MAG: ATP-binding protein [Acidimicrobiales bacterium]|nr:ATP-binding protein [Acidimicrobiales bacterium]
MESFTIPLTASIETPRTARSAVAERLGPHPRCEELLLCVSELVTNAVLHARSPRHMKVTAHGDQLTVEVADGDPTVPVRREHDPTAPTGRGLRILDQLTRRWGTRANGDGKTVWFEFDLGEGAA